MIAAAAAHAPGFATLLQSASSFSRINRVRSGLLKI
jgi:hypothetical protein